MGKPKVKKGKSGSRNDSVQQKEKLRRLKRGNGDAGLISEKTANVMKKKK